MLIYLACLSVGTLVYKFFGGMLLFVRFQVISAPICYSVLPKKPVIFVMENILKVHPCASPVKLMRYRVHFSIPNAL